MLLLSTSSHSSRWPLIRFFVFLFQLRLKMMLRGYMCLYTGKIQDDGQCWWWTKRIVKWWTEKDKDGKRQRWKWRRQQQQKSCVCNRSRLSLELMLLRTIFILLLHKFWATTILHQHRHFAPLNQQTHCNKSVSLCAACCCCCCYSVCRLKPTNYNQCSDTWPNTR